MQKLYLVVWTTLEQASENRVKLVRFGSISLITSSRRLLSLLLEMTYLSTSTLPQPYTTSTILYYTARHKSLQIEVDHMLMWLALLRITWSTCGALLFWASFLATCRRDERQAVLLRMTLSITCADPLMSSPGPPHCSTCESPKVTHPASDATKPSCAQPLSTQPSSLALALPASEEGQCSSSCCILNE